jgi:hypothetical protein
VRRFGTFGSLLALALWAGLVLVRVVLVVTYAPGSELPHALSDVVLEAPFVLVGAVLLRRRPDQPIGWLLAGAGCGLALTTTVNTYTDATLLYGATALPSHPVLSIAGNSVVIIPLTLGLIFLPVLFPSGRPLSDRWGRFLAVVVVLAVANAITAPFAEPDLRLWTEAGTIQLGANPLAAWPIAGVLAFVAVASFILLLLAVPTALAAVVIRFRRADPVERQQIRWLRFGLAAVVVGLGLTIVMQPVEAALGLAVPEVIWDLLLGAAVAVIPISVGIAVTRHGLYEIDRVVSRAVSYVVVTGVLAAAYAVGVMSFTHILGTFGRGSELAVAATTLAVAAMFGPVRRHVQGRVDRRFNHSRYDAQRTIEAFAGTLRDEVDLDGLQASLVATVGTTMQPVSASLWLREAAR